MGARLPHDVSMTCQPLSEVVVILRENYAFPMDDPTGFVMVKLSSQAESHTGTLTIYC